MDTQHSCPGDALSSCPDDAQAKHVEEDVTSQCDPENINKPLGKLHEKCTESFHNNCENNNSSGKSMSDSRTQCKQKHPQPTTGMDGNQKNISRTSPSEPKGLKPVFYDFLCSFYIKSLKRFKKRIPRFSFSQHLHK